MNAMDLLDAVGGAEDADILLAQKTRRKHRWIPWAAAACLLHTNFNSILTHCSAIFYNFFAQIKISAQYTIIT